MKKILQRIGLLAVAVMLLWGYQGMNAEAASDRRDLNTPENSHMTAVYDTYEMNGQNYGYIHVEAEKYYTFLYQGMKREDWQLPVIEIKRADGTTERPEATPYSDSNNRDWILYSITYRLNSVLADGDTVEITGGAERMQYTAGAYDTAQLVRSNKGDTFRMHIDTNYWLYSHTQSFIYTFTDENGNPVNYFEAGINFNTDYNQNATMGNYLFYVKMTDYSAPDGTYVLDVKDPYADVSSRLTFEVVRNIHINKLYLDMSGFAAGQPLPDKWKAEARALDDTSETPLVTWLKDGQVVTGEAENNTTFQAIVTLTPAEGFSFYDSISITTGPEQKDYTDIDLVDGKLVLTYTFTSGEATSADSREDNGNNNGNTGSSDNNSPDNTNPAPDSDNTADDSITPPGSDDENKDFYKIIEGAKGTWYGSTKEGLTVRGDGDFSKFAGVRVDGNWIPSDHYEAKSGSTIVTLKPSYLATLAAGEHTLSIMWIDDSASTTFTVASGAAIAQSELDDVPKTGEGVLGWMPEVLLFAAAGLVAAGVISRKQNKMNL